MEQRGERADFYIVNRKTFLKAQRVQPATMPQSKSNSENAYRVGAHNTDRYLFFLGLCLRLGSAFQQLIITLPAQDECGLP